MFRQRRLLGATGRRPTQVVLNRDSPQAKGLRVWWPLADGQVAPIRDYSGFGVHSVSSTFEVDDNRGGRLFCGSYADNPFKH